MQHAKYVLLTAACNEALYIRETLESVLSQTILPLKWIIICNNSSDETESIVEEYAREHAFISLLVLPHTGKRDFSTKVNSLQAGYETIKHLDFDLIGNLDADITLPEFYYERLLYEFQNSPGLGIGGGVYLDYQNGSYVQGGFLLQYPPGATLMFRRNCYDETGGFPPLPAGGEDSAASVLARMKGWQTKAFPHLIALHRRSWGTGANTSLLKGRYRQGIMDYHLGMHPIYALAKATSRISEAPYLFGSMCRLSGYLQSLLKREKRALPDEFIQYVREEQMNRLRSLVLFKIKQQENSKQAI